MPTSKRWAGLKQQVVLLRKQFLPVNFNHLGRYPRARQVRAHTRAFVVLSHAEIEAYLEDWAVEIADAADAVWKSKAKVTTPLAYLLATFPDLAPGVGGIPEPRRIPETIVDDTGKDPPQRFADTVNRVLKRFQKQIASNNGIKEKNVSSLFAPLGIPAAALGSTLLPNLNSLGKFRGSHAHSSAKTIASPLDAQHEFTKVEAVVNELRPFDDWLVIYKRGIR